MDKPITENEKLLIKYLRKNPDILNALNASAGLPYHSKNIFIEEKKLQRLILEKL